MGLSLFVGAMIVITFVCIIWTACRLRASQQSGQHITPRFGDELNTDEYLTGSPISVMDRFMPSPFDPVEYMMQRGVHPSQDLSDVSAMGVYGNGPDGQPFGATSEFP